MCASGTVFNQCLIDIVVGFLLKKAESEWFAKLLEILDNIVSKIKDDRAYRYRRQYLDNKASCALVCPDLANREALRGWPLEFGSLRQVRGLREKCGKSVEQ